jgi:hypothetical protein
MCENDGSLCGEFDIGMKAVQQFKYGGRGDFMIMCHHEQSVDKSPEVNDEVVISHFFTYHEHEYIREDYCTRCAHSGAYHLKEVTASGSSDVVFEHECKSYYDQVLSLFRNSCMQF